jgi:predicted thioesterase
MANIPIGAKREERLLVTEEVSIDFLGLDAARVLSTPHLIGYLEMTARNLIKERLDPGWDSVGTHVDLRHLAATPVGMSVRLLAEVISAGDRRVTCRIEAFDEREKIAEGTHERALVDVARFASRVAAKAASQ